MEPRSGIISWLGPPPTHPQLSFFFLCCAVSPPQLFLPSTKYVRCPPSHLSMLCGVPTPCVTLVNKVCAVSPLPVYFFSSSVSWLHLAMYWILSKVEYLSSFSLQDEVTDWLFCVLLGPSWIINLAQLVSLSVVLPAEPVSIWMYVEATSSY